MRPRPCRHCHEDLSTVPPTDAMTRHIVGLCAPSHNEVESAIEQLEIEDEREKEAIRAFWKREREQARVVTGKSLLWFMAKLMFWFAVVAAFVIGWLAQ